MKNLTTSIIAVTILILIGLGCSQSDTKTADNSKSNETANGKSNGNKNANGNSNDDKTTANSSSKTPVNLPATSGEDDITGNYGVTGKTPAGGAYQGDLEIKKQDEVYQFSWNAGGSVYDGVGVRDGDLIAVGYGAGKEGKGCGAAIYRISDDSLEGKLGMWGYNQTGTQTATMVKQKGNSGSFSVTGTDTDGTPYSGSLAMQKVKEDFFQLNFTSGKVKFSGTGIKVGDQFGVGIGFKQCGYVIFAIKPSGLNAVWGVIGSNTVGTETATRK